MIRCRTCVMPNTRPDTPFVDGICSACLAYARRPTIDWAERMNDLEALLERHDGRCIVPSSGGKDSHYQVLTLLELGAKPIVVTASTCQLSEVGRRNIDNLARYATTIEVTPNREQRRRLNRRGFEMVGDISWPEHVSIFTTPFRMAYKLGIPLIFYGENPQDQYGGPPGSEEAKIMTRRWVSEFGGFLGLRPEDLETMEGDMEPYKAIPDVAMEHAGIEAHFLGQYIPWDSHENAKVAIGAGMQVQHPSLANWWPWENLDNVQTGIHDHQMYRKYGYGRGCAQISVDVRTGRVKREIALEWVRRYDGWFTWEYLGHRLSEILEHVGITDRQFQDGLNQFTDWNLFVEGAPLDAMGRPPLKDDA